MLFFSDPSLVTVLGISSLFTSQYAFVPNGIISLVHKLTHSKHILKQWRSIAHLLQVSIRILLIDLFPRDLRVLLILPPEPKFQQEARHHAGRCEGKGAPKPGGVLGAFPLEVDERSGDAAHVADADHEGDADALLPCSREIVGSPGVGAGEDGEHADAGEDDGEVADGDVILDVCGKGVEHGKRNDDEGLAGHDGRHAPSGFVREKRGEIGGYRTANVGRDGEQLRIGGRVSHVPDDLRKRELQAIVWHGIRPKVQDLQIQVPVCNDVLERLPVEFLAALVNHNAPASGFFTESEKPDLILVKPSARQSG